VFDGYLDVVGRWKLGMVQKEFVIVGILVLFEWYVGRSKFYFLFYGPGVISEYVSNVVCLLWLK
jgi:hypothetical protein